MSKYIKLEDAISDLANLWDYTTANGIDTVTALRQVNADLLNLPTIEVSEGVIGQGSGDIDWQAVTSTGQEIYAKGYEDGRKSVETTEQSSKVGEWHRVSADKYVQHAYHFYRCSECGEDTIGEPNYCPNCGAKMREDNVEVD